MEKSEIIEADFKEKKTIRRFNVSSESGIEKFISEWKKYAKQNKVVSVFILTIDENDHCTWGLQSDSEYHDALACLTLEDLREEIKSGVFGDIYLDGEED